ncbi:MAG: energy-coupling factor transporter ATPase [Sporolactobacillus sp.]
MVALIHVETLKFQYLHNDNDKEWILDGLSLDISDGEFVAVLGPNGCGKSTLAKHFNALLTPSDGRVSVNGMDTRDERMKLAIRQCVGMIFQNPENQLISTIIEEDVAFAPENLGLPRAEIRRRVDEALAAVGMTAYRRHSPFALSGGQKQRVAIAGILAMRPQCLVLDEPTSMLDPEGRRDVLDTLTHLNQAYGLTIILITHEMDEAARAGRVIILERGRIAADAPPGYIFTQRGLLRRLHLGLPQAAELAAQLRERGAALPGVILDAPSCASAIAAALEGTQ